MKTALMLCTAASLALTTVACKKEQPSVGADASNAVIETIMARRSVRRYKDKPVEREKLELIVECGINAANGMNSQPWAVRVVEDPAFIEGTTDIFRAKQPDMVAMDSNFKTMYRNATTIICVASPADGSGNVDAGLLAGNIMLAAQSLGLGTCCMGSPAHFLNTTPEAAPYVEALEIPEGYVLSLVIAVGYPDESPAAKPRDKGKVKYIR